MQHPRYKTVEDTVWFSVHQDNYPHDKMMIGIVLQNWYEVSKILIFCKKITSSFIQIFQLPIKQCEILIKIQVNLSAMLMSQKINCTLLTGWRRVKLIKADQVPTAKLNFIKMYLIINGTDNLLCVQTTKYNRYCQVYTLRSLLVQRSLFHQLLN